METSRLARETLATRYFTNDEYSPRVVHRSVFHDAWPEDSKYHMAAVEVPEDWSQNSLNITAKLYLSKGEDRETSVFALVHRVALKITQEAIKAGYFPAVSCDRDDERDYWATEASVFYDELSYIMLSQRACFNSPVLFNVGREDRPQTASACYLMDLQDTTESIMGWLRDEAHIFKGGAGAGTNVSNLRGSTEPLSTGGTASGPVSFMRVSNANAGTFKSGGTTRRAARMIILDADHPDILDFVRAKAREEDRLQILTEAGVELGMGEEGERNIAESTAFQDANNSVSVTDEFMRTATGSDDLGGWDLIARKSGAVVETIVAGDLLDEIAEAAWRCADPGLFFHDTINRWHTTPSLGPIVGSNPCLPGETLVDTAEGRVRIDKLVEDYVSGVALPRVFSFDTETSLPVLRQIRKAWMTKMVTELVEVRTEKGLVVRSTPEHPFMVRSGGRSSDSFYVEAKDLKPGQSLRKIGRWVNEERSARRCLNHRETEQVPNGTAFQAPWMWEQAYGPIPDDMEIHHVNEDPTDDRLSNFELIDVGTHQSFHSIGERNPRFIDSKVETLVEVFEYAERLPHYKGRMSYHRWSRAVQELGLVGQVARGNFTGIRGMNWIEFADWIEDQRTMVNDRVVSIEHIMLDEAIPVYDIEVDGTHNFAVANEGIEHTIIVHNCAEVVQPPNSSCNLASINLLKFLSWHRDEPAEFDVEAFEHTVDVMTLAMDVLVSFCDTPNEEITQRTRDYRWLGLGYTNLGAALMAQGLPYDSDLGRDFAASVTALLTGRAYQRSALLAKQMGAYSGWVDNRSTHLNVLEMHREHANDAGSTPIWSAARTDWMQAIAVACEHGVRNAQATVLAPTGSISFFMGCDTTGVEPAFALVTHKTLSGGESMVLVNGSVRRAARSLGGYSDEDIRQMSDGDLSSISKEDEAIFHCANDISYEGHIKMMAAVQPFLSGSISKTINMPNEATVEDIKKAYVLAWRLGVKALSIYRDGSKTRQVHSAKPTPDVESAGDEETIIIQDTFSVLDPDALVKAMGWQSNINGGGPQEQAAGQGGDQAQVSPPPRRRLPRTRSSLTHKIHLRGQTGEYEGYVTVGRYADGSLGEMFVEGFGKAGSFTANALAAWATDFSIGVQYGVPWEVLCRKHRNVTDETGGMVMPGRGDDEPLVIRSAKSIIDYIVRWVVLEFGDRDLREEFGVLTPAEKIPTLDVGDLIKVDVQRLQTVPGAIESKIEVYYNGHAPNEMGSSCPECGGLMVPTGSCYACTSCAYSSGCS